MLASVVTGPYCRVHQLLFLRSLQEWLAFSPAHIAHAFGDAMQVVEAPCPRCLAMPPTARHDSITPVWEAQQGPRGSTNHGTQNGGKVCTVHSL
jgi:hypothetical protein